MPFVAGGVRVMYVDEGAAKSRRERRRDLGRVVAGSVRPEGARLARTSPNGSSEELDGVVRGRENREGGFRVVWDRRLGFLHPRWPVDFALVCMPLKRPFRGGVPSGWP